MASQSDIDARVQVKIVDKSSPSTQQMIVDTDSNAHVEVHGNDPAGLDRVIKTSETGATTVDGFYNATTNTVPSQVGLIAHTRATTPALSDQNMRITAITAGTVRALDVAIRDEQGLPFSSTNPMPVFVTDSEGLEYNNYNTAAAIAAGATSNHDYTALAPIKLTKVAGTASGRSKLEVQVETGSATNVFNTFCVLFNSTSSPNMEITFQEPIAVLTGARVRVIRTNREVLSAQDLYSLIEAHDS